MPSNQVSEILHDLRQALMRQEAAGLTDGQLLELFIEHHDEAAVEALVRRHGPMVWGVCRRLLQSHHDAEDTFQATFLVLIRKAASIQPREMVANWLYGVAYRTASKARATAGRRRAMEKQLTKMPEPAAAEQACCDDLLDQELRRLPDNYRTAIVLCDLEGKSRKEVAQQLGLPEGTVASRLARARAMLAKRLARYGHVLSESAAPASVPPSLLASTIKLASLIPSGKAVPAGVVSARVVALAEGVMRAMVFAKLKLVAGVCILIALLGIGTGLGVHKAMLNASIGDGSEKRQAAKVAERSREKRIWRDWPTIPRQAGWVHTLAFAPDGKTLAVGVAKIRLADGKAVHEATLYDPLTGKEQGSASGSRVAFSPDGKTLATAGGDGFVRVNDRRPGGKQRRLSWLPDTVLCLAFSPDGKMLAAGSGNPSKPTDPGRVRVWDLENDTERTTYLHTGAVYAVAFSPDSKTLLSASSGEKTVIKTWDTVAARERGEVDAPRRRFLAIAFAPDGKSAAAGVLDDPIGDTSEMDVKVWELATGKQVCKPLRHSQVVQTMAFSPDGKILATGTSSMVGEDKRIGVVHLWDVATGKERATLRGDAGEVVSLAFDRRGQTLVTGSSEGTVKIWELGDPEDDRLWVKSADGILALRVSARLTRLRPGDPIELAATLRNLSNKPVNVLRPFGVPQVVSGSIDIRGPRGKLGYRGIPPSFRVAADAFIRLGPGESIRQTIKLDAREYTGLETAGEYTLTFTYKYNGMWDKQAEQGGLTRIWRGAISGKGIPIEVRDGAEGARKIDPRVRAFVAYLERNGIKLVSGEEPRQWRIVEPRHRGVLTVQIKPFSPLVSETWMRDALRETSWAAELNAPARLGMSRSISVAQAGKEKPDEVKAIERKLLDLFRRYKSPAEVVAADERAAKELQALLAFMKDKGVELRPADTEKPGNYIQRLFSIGPDHNKKMLVGINYLPPLTAAEAREAYRKYQIPSVIHHSWAMFAFGYPGAHGNATEEYAAAWKKVEAAFKASELNAAQAFRAFREEIVKKLPRQAADYWLAQPQNDKTWSLRRQSFADGLRRVENTLTETERKTAILHGKLADLRRKGECWTVEYIGGYFSLVGYVDPASGKLVFLWLPPEG